MTINRHSKVNNSHLQYRDLVLHVLFDDQLNVKIKPLTVSALCAKESILPLINSPMQSRYDPHERLAQRGGMGAYGTVFYTSTEIQYCNAGLAGKDS